MLSNFGESKRSKYKKLAKIGEGAYGVVYKAEDQVANKMVAIKKMMMQIDHEGIPSTALREISLLREIEHDNVVKLLDLIIEDGKFYLIFEYLDRDLKDFLASYPPEKFPEPRLVRSLMRQLLEGVASCHAKRVLHRDLKPQNILLGKDNLLKIADFGLARAFSIPTRPYTNGVVSSLSP
eukprot:TRINITY_DN3979_c0_g1_i2.p1 TRINITY_DN3979_c0_g1~~TRINITY_DN3979_c0_g1_i2.p1  ORF type:complete len:180 (+),score=52.38 TRINITY_DN3979_c0_g1_i2:57-596(+)